MKYCKLFLVALLFTTVLSPLALAQSNQGFSYQAIARDAGGALLTNESITIGFEIRRTSPTGTLIYAESHDTTTNSFGAVSLTIGGGMPVFGIFSSINWDSEEFYLVTTINTIIAGSTKLASVPYSKLATEMVLENLTDVSVDTPISGEILGWDGSGWVNLTYTTGGDLSGDLPAPTVVALQGLAVSEDVPTNGQVLLWDETNEIWQPGTVTANGSISAGEGIELDGSIINNIGDTDSTDDVTLTTDAGGDISGTFGDLSVTGLQGGSISDVAPADGQILKWDEVEGEWAPADEAGNAYSAGSGISILSNVISNTGDADPGDDITESTTAGGDVGGTFDALSVVALRGQDISLNAPSDGQVLTWDDTESEWTPGPSGLWSAGTSEAAVYAEDIEVGAANAADGQSEYIQVNGESDAWYIGVQNENDAANTGFFVGLTASDDDVFHITNTGKIGVGTNDPTHTLHVKHPTGGGFAAGNGLKIENASTSTASWLVYANLGDQLQILPSSGVGGYFSNVDGSYNTASDLTLKTNILSMGAVLPSILQLEAKTYEYKQSLGKRTIGFIAQDVYALFPELVKQMPAERGSSYYTLNYAGFGVLALKAIQEQQQIIEEQKQALESLEARLEALEARLNK
ncbi:MAG: tail fiber domain-containing protein [Bacteroidota bacterium]